MLFDVHHFNSIFVSVLRAYISTSFEEQFHFHKYTYTHTLRFIQVIVFIRKILSNENYDFRKELIKKIKLLTVGSLEAK